MATNYATQYQQALDQPFKSGLKSEALYDHNRTSTNRFRFVEGKTIKVSTLTVEGMNDVDRDNIAWATRRHSNEWKSYELTHDREFDTLVDPMDIDETNLVYSMGNISGEFVRKQLIPEMDKYMFSKLYSDVDTLNGTINTDAITDGDTALATFDKLMEEMDENEVPEEGRIAYVTPEIHRFLKEALNSSRQLGTTPAITDVNRIIGRLDEVDLIKVPSARMKTAYDFSNAPVPAAGAETMRMIIVQPESVLAPMKVDTAMMSEPTAATKGKWIYYQRQYWDVFVLAEKYQGIAINVTV